MDTALTPPTNSQSLPTWLGVAGTLDLEQAVPTTTGGGARTEAVRKKMANLRLSYDHMTEKGWKEALGHLYSGSICKYGKRPAGMVARLGVHGFQGKGHEDERCADFVFVSICVFAWMCFSQMNVTPDFTRAAALRSCFVSTARQSRAVV